MRRSCSNVWWLFYHYCLLLCNSHDEILNGMTLKCTKFFISFFCKFYLLMENISNYEIIIFLEIINAVFFQLILSCKVYQNVYTKSQRNQCTQSKAAVFLDKQKKSPKLFILFNLFLLKSLKFISWFLDCVFAPSSLDCFDSILKLILSFEAV